jgi:hypothetical protein
VLSFTEKFHAALPRDVLLSVSEKNRVKPILSGKVVSGEAAGRSASMPLNADFTSKQSYTRRS